MNRLAATLLIGCALGWFARAHITADRYLTALAARMIAETSYINKKADAIIETNQKETKRGQKKN